MDPSTLAAQRKRTLLYQTRFKLPDSETLVADFACALEKTILLQGRMYISQNFVCFYANIFGSETNVVIPASDITGVQRARVAMLIPNSIRIYTTYNTFFFASFLHREDAYKLLLRVSKGEPIDGAYHTEGSEKDTAEHSSADSNARRATMRRRASRLNANDNGDDDAYDRDGGDDDGNDDDDGGGNRRRSERNPTNPSNGKRGGASAAAPGRHRGRHRDDDDDDYNDDENLDDDDLDDEDLDDDLDDDASGDDHDGPARDLAGARGDVQRKIGDRSDIYEHDSITGEDPLVAKWNAMIMGQPKGTSLLNPTRRFLHAGFVRRQGRRVVDRHAVLFNDQFVFLKALDKKGEKYELKQVLSLDQLVVDARPAALQDALTQQSKLTNLIRLIVAPSYASNGPQSAQSIAAIAAATAAANDAVATTAAAAAASNSNGGGVAPASTTTTIPAASVSATTPSNSSNNGNSSNSSNPSPSTHVRIVAIGVREPEHTDQYIVSFNTREDKYEWVRLLKLAMARVKWQLKDPLCQYFGWHYRLCLGTVHGAVYMDDAVLLDTLLRDNRDSLKELDLEGNALLHVAAHMNSARMTEKLVDLGCNVQQVDRDNFTPVHLAARKGFPNVLEALMRSKQVDVSMWHTTGKKPLHLRTTSAFWMCMLGAQGSWQRCASVFLNSLKGGVTQFLDERDDDGMTLVEIMCHQNRVDALAWLIQAGASVDVPNAHGRTPLAQASAQGRAAAVTCLIQFGAQVNLRPHSSLNAPLHHAASLEVATILVAAGARTNLKNAKQVRAGDVFPAPAAQAKMLRAEELYKARAPVTTDDSMRPQAATFVANGNHALETCVLCQEEFTLVRKREYCRRCGRNVCGPCSLKKVIFRRVRNGKKERVLARVCAGCYNLVSNRADLAAAAAAMDAALADGGGGGGGVDDGRGGRAGAAATANRGRRGGGDGDDDDDDDGGDGDGGARGAVRGGRNGAARRRNGGDEENGDRDDDDDDHADGHANDGRSGRRQQRQQQQQQQQHDEHGDGELVEDHGTSLGGKMRAGFMFATKNALKIGGAVAGRVSNVLDHVTDRLTNVSVPQDRRSRGDDDDEEEDDHHDRGGREEEDEYQGDRRRGGGRAGRRGAGRRGMDDYGDDDDRGGRRGGGGRGGGNDNDDDDDDDPRAQRQRGARRTTTARGAAAREEEEDGDDDGEYRADKRGGRGNNRNNNDDDDARPSRARRGNSTRSLATSQQQQSSSQQQEATVAAVQSTAQKSRVLADRNLHQMKEQEKKSNTVLDDANQFGSLTAQLAKKAKGGGSRW